MTAPLTYRIDWRGIALLVTHTPQQWGMEHIEIESEDRRPFPVSGTGYKSIFLCEEDLAEYESAADFVRQWLDFAAQESWHGKQLSLF